MGMLLTHHRGYWPEGKGPKPAKGKNRRGRRREAEAPAPEVSPYDELTDEQVAEAFAATFGDHGVFVGRDEAVALLESADAGTVELPEPAEGNPAE